MGCQIYFQNPQTICNSSRTKPTVISSLSSLQTQFKTRTIKIIASSNNDDDHQSSLSSTTITVPKTEVYNVKFQTLGGCKLGISRYPDFAYNAEGGGGTGIGKKIADDDEIHVDFDLKTLYIPPLTSSTTKFLGLSLPPFLKIEIVPEFFQGRINQVSGKVELEFKAKFLFSAGNIYRAPPLMVETVLTSDESKGMIRRGRGEKLDENGKCSLVGVATVQPIEDLFMNTFLSLPTECLANLNAIITFSTT